MVTTGISGGGSTYRLVNERFDASSEYARDAVDDAREYMDDLEELLKTLDPADTSDLDDVSFDAISGLDYSEIPPFTDLIEDFPLFSEMALNEDSILPSTRGIEPPSGLDDDYENDLADAIEPAEFTDVPFPQEPNDGPTKEGLELDNIDESFPDLPNMSVGNLSFDSVDGDLTTGYPNIPGTLSLEAIPDITGSVPTKSFNFIFNSPDKPTMNYGTAPSEPSLSAITLPDAPSLNMPAAPPLTDIAVPTPPTIDLPDFTANAPSLESPAEPTSFSFTEAPYNSDIRVALFNKILNDIINGGTGLDVTVEQEIWDRYLARQTAENDRLYQEVQDQFAATGFGLPSGAYAARLLQVSSDISMKNDQASRDITIAQAELAQKNTQFTTEQAGILEKMLADFFNAQQTRSLQAQQALAANAVEIYNAMVNRQTLLLEEYKTEAQVFESKIRAELSAIEIYRAEVEGVKATVEVQQARVNLYNSQVAAVELFMKIYQTEMDSAKIQAEIQNLQLGLFKTRTEAYLAQIEAEKAKADVYKTEVSAEGIRADAFRSEVAAYESEVKGRLGVIEAERIKSANKIAENQQKIEEYKAYLEKYRTERDAERLNIEQFNALLEKERIKSTNQTAQNQQRIEVFKANTEHHKAEIEKEKAQATIKISENQLKIDKYKALIAAFTAELDAERLKIERYKADIEVERIKTTTQTTNSQQKLETHKVSKDIYLADIEKERIKATTKIEENKLIIDEYRAKIDKYRSEIEAEIRTASLSVSAYQAHVAAYQATTGAKEMEFRARMSEAATKIEYAKAELQKAVAKIESETNAYVALKQLAVAGTEGLMNANAQLAASAMNAVSASASLGDSYGASMGVSHNHSYEYEM